MVTILRYLEIYMYNILHCLRISTFILLFISPNKILNVGDDNGIIQDR